MMEVAPLKQASSIAYMCMGISLMLNLFAILISISGRAVGLFTITIIIHREFIDCIISWCFPLCILLVYTCIQPGTYVGYDCVALYILIQFPQNTCGLYVCAAFVKNKECLTG